VLCRMFPFQLGSLVELVVASPNQGIRETLRSSIADLLFDVGPEYVLEDLVELDLAVSRMAGDDRRYLWWSHSAINAIMSCHAN